MKIVIKRVFDLSISILLLILSLPLLLMVAITIFIFLGRPVFFIQSRPGLDNKSFNLIKFRTMLVEASANSSSEGDRMTKIGRFLRSTSLDELPELINVIRGDMSLVGPRPLLEEYLELYDEEQIRRHDVKPGLTGWAQINGRNNIEWEERFKLDLWYVEKNSFLLDIKIILLTIYKVILRKDISYKTSPTMMKFSGNKESEESK